MSVAIVTAFPLAPGFFRIVYPRAGDCIDHAARGARDLAVTNFWRWPANCRALVSQECLKANARQAWRDIVRAPRHAARRSSLSTPTGCPAITSFGPVTGKAATGTP